MRVLVTGGTGVLGRAFRPLAEAAGHDVRAPGRAGLDLFGPLAVGAAVRDVDAVLHLATRIQPLGRMGQPEAWRENDRLRAEGSAILVDAALAADVKTYVQPTVTFVYPGDRPVSEETPVGDVPVILRSALVNVALPHIQRALGFSGANLEWVINAYALAFGGLLLLGGRAGDMLGRRKVFITGIIVFSAASLAGGFATTQAWLLTARAIQGAGAAITAPTALSLVTTTFPEGPPRNRAMGVYGAMSVTGGVVGLIAGGLLTTYASWRWVLFVNVPIGIAVALAAPRVLGETPGQRGRVDLPGAITGTGGLAALVYGLSNAATSPDGVSHWGDAKVVASLAAAVVLLATFAAVEIRSTHALLPVRLLRSRDRSGAYLIMLCVGTALFGMFFFLTIFLQTVWGYSALRTGVAYLPMMAAIMAMSGASAQLVPRIGARPLLLAGSATATGGMFWLSRVSEHSHYTTGLLGPTLVAGVGLGMLFMPLAVVALSRVQTDVSGAASGLLNAGQQVGGSIGLAVLGTVAWTAVANSIRGQSAAAAAAAARAGRPAHQAAAGGLPAAVYRHALATGFSRAFEVSAGILLLALITTIAAIRVRRADLAGAPGPTGQGPPSA